MSTVVSLCLFHSADNIWVQRRDSGFLGGTLELPGGKIEKNETSEEACQREVEEEIGFKLDFSRIKKWRMFHHEYETITVALFIHLVQVQMNELPKEGWYKLDELLENQEIPEANIEIFRAFKSFLQENR